MTTEATGAEDGPVPPRERAWPLSAAASFAVLEPRSTTPRDVLLLALKELVGRGAWHVRKEDTRSRLRSRTTVLLRPGPRPDRPLPLPLDVLEAWMRPLRLDSSGELPMPALAKRLRASRGDRWAAELLDSTRARLEHDGLLTVRRRLLLGDRWDRTPSGEAWAREIATRTRALREDLPGLVETDRATAAELLARAGWLLLLVPEAAEHLPALREWREQRRGDAGVGSLGSGGGDGWAIGDGDGTSGVLGASDPWTGLDSLGNLDAFDGLDSVFDGAFDSAVTGGDFGGSDFGGGDGGGGGGDGGGN